jgi:hypothetical protein
MESWKRLKARFETVAVRASLATIAAHVVNASLFHMDGPFPERLAWPVAVVAAGAAAAYYFPSLSRALKGVVGTMFGLPAFIAGLGIHGTHVYQLGFQGSDYTGIPLAVAGLLLTVIGTTALVRLIYTWWRRLFLIPIGALFAFFVIFPVTLGVAASNNAHFPCCTETPADYGFAYEDVTFKTAAGLELSAWYVPTQNEAVVIMVHGAGKNRARTMSEALVLARHGYGLLMVDLEGFGNSEGRSNAFGWVGARGVHAAVEYLRSRSDLDPERIGGLGLSMGGEVLLQAAGESAHLKAIVAEGATGRTAADFGEAEDGWFKPIVPFHTVVGLTMRLITGESTPPPLKEMVQQIGPRRVLLIAGNLAEEKKLMGLYVELGGPSFELWTIPEPKHVGAYALHPEEYEQRVIAFFDDALLGSAR